MKKEPTAICQAIDQFSFKGHIIPAEWYQTITRATTKGKVKADILAINILSEIIYWYRISETKDEKTGRILRYERKFDADKLQRSYQALADYFGISKRQATDACHRLRDGGLITLELRNFTTKTGLALNNVLYIEPVPEAIKDVTFPRDTSPEKEVPLSRKKVTPIPEKGDTNTESSTQISKRKADALPVQENPPELTPIKKQSPVEEALAVKAPGGNGPIAKSGRPLTEHQVYFGELADALNIPLDAMSKKQAGRLNKFSKRVRDGGYTLIDIRKARLNWQETWPGNTNSPPTDDQFVQCLEGFKKDRDRREALLEVQRQREARFG